MSTNTTPTTINHDTTAASSGSASDGHRRRARWSRRLLTAATAALALIGVAPVIDASPAQAAGNPVLLVHGFSKSGSHNCDSYWATMRSYLESQGRTVYTVGYYPNHQQKCDLQVDGAESNTTDTSLEWLGYQFAKLVRDEFTNASGGPITVDIVAHSMGGLVVRDALDDQPSYLRADNVVTLGSPHAGAKAADLVNFFSLGTCAGVRQCKDMTTGSSFLANLEANPQSSVTTKWTLIATVRDEVIGATSGTSMARGSTSKPTVVPKTFSKSARSDTNCYGFEPVTHNDVKENVAIGRCTWPWIGPPTYIPMKNAARLTWDAID